MISHYQVLKLMTVPYRLNPHQQRDQDVGEECLFDYEQQRAGKPYVNQGYEPDQHVEKTQF